jgi:hypothetical protein
LGAQFNLKKRHPLENVVFSEGCLFICSNDASEDVSEDDSKNVFDDVFDVFRDAFQH